MCRVLIDVPVHSGVSLGVAPPPMRLDAGTYATPPLVVNPLVLQLLVVPSINQPRLIRVPLVRARVPNPEFVHVPLALLSEESPEAPRVHEFFWVPLLLRPHFLPLADIRRSVLKHVPVSPLCLFLHLLVLFIIAEGLLLLFRFHLGGGGHGPIVVFRNLVHLLSRHPPVDGRKHRIVVIVVGAAPNRSCVCC